MLQIIKLKYKISGLIKQMPKIIDMLYISVTNELMSKPLMGLEHDIQKLLDKGFIIKGKVIVKVYRSGITKYIQHLVKYDSN
jgi:hypothetical protein